MGMVSLLGLLGTILTWRSSGLGLHGLIGFSSSAFRVLGLKVSWYRVSGVGFVVWGLQ